MIVIIVGFKEGMKGEDGGGYLVKELFPGRALLDSKLQLSVHRCNTHG